MENPDNNVNVSQIQNKNNFPVFINRSVRSLLFCVLLVLVSGLAGYFYGFRSRNNIWPFSQSQNVILPVGKVEVTPGKSNNGGSLANPTTRPLLIKKQQILAVGIVTDYDGKSITVRSDDNTTGVFKLAASVMIYPIEIQEGKQVLGTHDKSTIKTDQKAAITLDLYGEEYLVTNITYIKK